MTIIFLILAICIVVGLVLFVTTRTVFFLSYRERRLTASLTVLGCGVHYADGRIGIGCGRLVHYFKPSPEEPRKKKKAKKAEREAAKEGKKPKKGRRMKLGVILRIAKALFLFVVDMLSRIRYDGGELTVVPVIADPAIAGMAYGWGQAFYGVFPALRRTIDVVPTYGREKSRLSGHIALSFPNRGIVVPVWRLLRNMPIKELIRHRFSGRGG